MSKPKILDLTIEKLKEIAQSINENTAANRTKSKEAKISTDIFIKQFEINRKDFSETIKDTDIKYNKSTFLYDIGEVNLSTTKVNIKGVNKNSENVNYTKPVDIQEVYQESNLKEIQSIQENTFQLPQEFKEDDINEFKEDIKGLNIKETTSTLDDEISSDTDISNMNQDIYNLLKSQLEEKDLQLKGMDLRIHELHELVENSQILLKEKPQDIKLLEQHFQDLDDKIMNIKERNIPQQKGLFKKWFKK